MAAEEPLSAKAKRQPPVGLGADLQTPSGHPRPGAPSANSSGSSSWPSPPPAFHSSPGGPPHLTARSASPSSAEDPKTPPLKPVHRFLPPSRKTFFRRWWRWSGEEPSHLTYSPGFQISPPVTPVLESPQKTNLNGEESSTSSERKDEEDGKEPPLDTTASSKSGKTMSALSQGGTSTAPPGYKERSEAYDRKYAYLKSWPGLLRLLGSLELILGGMVFACTAAYIQKDYQWSQLYGNSFLPYNSLTGTDYGYYGPMTPFVLVVASLVWLVTVILLGLGVTMHYRTILLNSHWWPLTEFALNLSMFLLYLAAAIAYVNNINRGGLCYSVFAYSPLITALCQVEGGQVAAITFLFLTTLLYLMGSLVCLKMWRHEAAQRMLLPPKPLLLQGASEHTVVPQGKKRPAGRIARRVVFSQKGDPGGPNHAVPMGHNPKPLIIPDYVVRYPAITSLDERQRYKAIFNDQYSEYQELFREVLTTWQKFKELDALMCKLPVCLQNKEEQSRVSAVWREYRGKKKDPAFLEKQQRCQYLKKKLSHLKMQIQAFDSDQSEPSMIL